MDDIAKLTYPQILMLNHAASVNKKRLDARIKRQRESGSLSLRDEIADMPLVNGKRLTEMTTDELLSHHGGEGPSPRVIKLKKE